MKIGVWQKGAVIILSLVLSFLFSVSLGMVSPLNRNVQNFAVDDVIGSKVTKIVNPEPTTTPIVPGQSLAVQLNITGIGSESIISQPIDIVTVIDLSRSMNDVDASGQAKLKSVKKTLNNLIDLIAQSNDQRSEENKIRLGLVSFGCGAWGVSGFCDPGKMTETKKWNDFSLDPAVLKESVESLTVANYDRNYTNMGDGLLLAGGGGKYSGDGKNYDFDGMLAQSKANESDRYLKSQKITILLSDGVQNGNIDATNKQVLDFYRNEKIPIYTIGYGLAGVTEVDAYPPMDRSVDQL
ncbi:MAG: VWA domain-containing protein, partial [Patescibacteria group bacterium]|nr:VWA domain-containing protein [Patescibacteria group bacterium]